MAERVRVREISNEEGNRLLRIVRRQSGSVVTWRRAQMVLLSAQGMDVAQIATVAFTSEDRVRAVIHNFNADGFDSLYPRYAGGRPPTFTLPSGGSAKYMTATRPPDGSVNVMVATSTDHGSTFASHVRLSTVHWPPAIPGVNPRSGPAIAIDPTTGDMYAAVATSGSDAQASEVDVFTSHDSGRSWSPPVPAVHAVGVTYLQPQLAVDDNGRLGLEAFGLANGRVNLILLSSSSRAATFGPLRTVTEGGGFDPTLGLANSESASAQHWFGDYQGLTTAGGVFHAVWNDTSPGHLELFTAAIAAAPSG